VIPWWVPLAAAAIALLGTVVGVPITQRWSAHREDARWKREREQEREAWESEDAARTFEQRRQAYVDFYKRLRADARTVNYTGLDHGPSLERGAWHLTLYAQLGVLRLYATPLVDAAAGKAYSALWTWGYQTQRDSERFPKCQEAYDAAEHELRDAIRADLGVPGQPIPRYYFHNDK